VSEKELLALAVAHAKKIMADTSLLLKYMGATDLKDIYSALNDLSARIKIYEKKLKESNST